MKSELSLKPKKKHRKQTNANYAFWKKKSAALSFTFKCWRIFISIFIIMQLYALKLHSYHNWYSNKSTKKKHKV